MKNLYIDLLYYIKIISIINSYYCILLISLDKFFDTNIKRLKLLR